MHTATVDLVDALISVFMFFTALRAERQKVWPHFYSEFLFLYLPFSFVFDGPHAQNKAS